MELKYFKKSWEILGIKRNLILGQIKAKLTIRPIEAVESFDITINMTDQEIEVIEGEE